MGFVIPCWGVLGLFDMGLYKLLLTLTSIELLFVCVVHSEHFPLQHISSCSNTEYFSSISFQCVPCGKFKIQNPSGLGCRCDVGYFHTAESADVAVGRAPLDGASLQCLPCPPSMTSTDDGDDCVPCAPPLRFEPASRRCTACPPKSITVSRSQNGSLLPQTCLACDNTAVVSSDNSCVRCRHFHLVAKNGSCVCPDGHQMMHGVCVVSVDMIQVPTDISMYRVDFGSDFVLESELFRKLARMAVYLCRFRRNTTSCHLLLNLCTLTLYSYGSMSSTCGQLRRLSSSLSVSSRVAALYYADDEAEALLSRTRITQQFTVDSLLKTSYLNLSVARFSLDGRLLSVQPVSHVPSRSCSRAISSMSSGFRFGVRVHSECTLSVDELFGPSRLKTEFYQLYLNYDGNSLNARSADARLYSVPVRVLDYSAPSGQQPNKLSDRHRWQLVRRFMLIDTVSALNSDIKLDTGDSVQVVRYASHIRLDVSDSMPTIVQEAYSGFVMPRSVFIHSQATPDILNVEMRLDPTQPGMIYPPLLSVQYQSVIASHVPSTGVSVHLDVVYSTKLDKSREQIEVTVGVLSVFAILWAVFRTWIWSGRNGHSDINLATIVKLGVSVCSNLSTVFVMVSLGSCCYWMLFFKQQTVAFILLPSDQQQALIKHLVVAAYLLKTVEVGWVLYEQVNVDIFLIDWERARGVTAQSSSTHQVTNTTSANQCQATSAVNSSVSIWRTYFIANEWNELQTSRRISSTGRLITLLFFLQVLGLIRLSYWTPDVGVSDADQPDIAVSFICRFCVISITFAIITTVQWVFSWCISDRFFSNPVQLFVDLCSVANISVFLLAHRLQGHYIHGRSVHGSADADLATLCAQLRREQLDLCARRGLTPGSNQQIFQILLPSAFRRYYDNIVSPIHSVNGGGVLKRSVMGSGDEGHTGAAVLTSAESAAVMANVASNRFLSAFIEHSLKHMDYVVKDKQYIELMFDLEFAESSDRGTFYNDTRNSFVRVLLYGSEVCLSMHELLLFVFVDIFSCNLLISAIVVYFTAKAIAAVRYHFGRLNLARKTLVDARFLV